MRALVVIVCVSSEHTLICLADRFRMGDLSILGAVMGQFEVKLPVVHKRGRYSNEFKRELVAACRAPGVSVTHTQKIYSHSYCRTKKSA
jgi:hypothetical protein